ncbi:mechanosensitive ion channel family protein [Promicromonospora iranensis]|uniref:Small-conductance mechanosensitive channel n=1 Tax=Promicromonospora iranensis TaxID=1105144 RepID=A0ABU2CVZ6_9MICO|nr:mechanosensitive ion channel domain-containing protein [Promicromonospora iranensis]MDR7385524.1 small-conductance mechanosensitive channel [Promicromonospora iranensis]
MVDALARFFSTDDLDGWDVLFAALTLLGTWLAARYARRAVLAATARIKGLTPQVQDLVLGTVNYLVLLAGIGLALTFLGAQTQPILTVVVVVGIVVVLTMRGLADNFGAGILLQTRMPVKVGEELVFGDWTGVVTALNSRAVVLETYDGVRVHVPNSAVISEPLVNGTGIGARRSVVEVRLAHLRDDEIDGVLLPAVSAAPGVHAAPAPDALHVAADSARTTLLVRYWHGSLDGSGVTSAVVAALGTALRSRTAAWAVDAPPSRAAERRVPSPPV